MMVERNWQPKVERSWRINPQARGTRDLQKLDELVGDGVLDLDTRLDAIADAWRKYMTLEGWVDGIAPVLGLLDALIGKTDDKDE